MGTEDPAIARAARYAAMGAASAPPRDEADAAQAVTHDPDARVRAAAVAMLVRAGSAATAHQAWDHAIRDLHPAVRRRAAELAPRLATRVDAAATLPGLVGALADPEVTVVDAAAWALGELGDAVPVSVVDALADVATNHDDPLAREAAVAALGAIGDPAGLEAVLAACHDKPAVRRRAVLALAPFEGDAVEAALRDALDDRDWQTRQAAEDLSLGDPAPEEEDADLSAETSRAVDP